CTFGNEFVTFYGFEGRGKSIVLSFVIARYHNDLSAVFQSYLSGSDNMAGRMKRNAHPVNGKGFAVPDARNVDGGRYPRLQNRDGVVMAQIRLHSPARMV